MGAHYGIPSQYQVTIVLPHLPLPPPPGIPLLTHLR